MNIQKVYHLVKTWYSMEFKKNKIWIGGVMWMKKYVIDILMIMLGSLLFALAVNLFVIPNDLGEGA